MSKNNSKCELDYYAILNVPRDASKEEITLSYRKLAVLCNPHRDEQHDEDFIPTSWKGDISHLNSLTRGTQWAYINMAFDVLSHPLRREIYDRFGEAGLFQGVALPNGYFHPYMYHGDHLKVYHSVFGSYSPFSNLIDIATNPPPLYSNKNGIGVRIKEPPVEKIIPLDLKEVFFGTMKRMKIFRQEYVDDLETVTEKREKTILVNIPPGTKAGTKFVFANEGDRNPTTIPADIIFITIDKPDTNYLRDGNNLIHVREISLCEALVGFKFSLQTIDDRKLVTLITDVVTQDYEKIIHGEGLPKVNTECNEPEKGNLILRFKINFPILIPRHLKCEVKTLFDKIDEEIKKMS
ncbi:dnaJ homolog subfamily B member 13 [Eupeodes corollae]|uniref:dnaJ homolog subfamily B member 13 n=1 Tax=Eupeodes corollae TaxID=290404 RepID=UPI002493C48D|nr:dnaJ homolog subfamily B member 13 [Eupeodes corollae]